MKKQIEEMAKDIEKSHWKIVQDFMGCHINSEEMAEHLYAKGYCRASEVAREIFAEISEILFDYEKAIRAENRNAFEARFAELKKKYESEGGE